MQEGLAQVEARASRATVVAERCELDAAALTEHTLRAGAGKGQGGAPAREAGAERKQYFALFVEAFSTILVDHAQCCVRQSCHVTWRHDRVRPGLQTHLATPHTPPPGTPPTQEKKASVLLFSCAQGSHARTSLEAAATRRRPGSPPQSVRTSSPIHLGDGQPSQALL